MATAGPVWLWRVGGAHVPRPAALYGCKKSHRMGGLFEKSLKSSLFGGVLHGQLSETSAMDMTTITQGGDAFDQLETTADSLTEMAAGVQLLSSLLLEGQRVGLDPSVAKSISGLLRPIQAEMIKHANAIRSVLPSE